METKWIRGTVGLYSFLVPGAGAWPAEEHSQGPLAPSVAGG